METHPPHHHPTHIPTAHHHLPPGKYKVRCVMQCILFGKECWQKGKKACGGEYNGVRHHTGTAGNTREPATACLSGKPSSPARWGKKGQRKQCITEEKARSNQGREVGVFLCVCVAKFFQLNCPCTYHWEACKKGRRQEGERQACCWHTQHKQEE